MLGVEPVEHAVGVLVADDAEVARVGCAALAEADPRGCQRAVPLALVLAVIGLGVDLDLDHVGVERRIAQGAQIAREGVEPVVGVGAQEGTVGGVGPVGEFRRRLLRLGEGRGVPVGAAEPVPVEPEPAPGGRSDLRLGVVAEGIEGGRAGSAVHGAVVGLGHGVGHEDSEAGRHVFPREGEPEQFAGHGVHDDPEMLEGAGGLDEQIVHEMEGAVGLLPLFQQGDRRGGIVGLRQWGPGRVPQIHQLVPDDAGGREIALERCEGVLPHRVERLGRAGVGGIRDIDLRRVIDLDDGGLFHIGDGLNGGAHDRQVVVELLVAHAQGGRAFGGIHLAQVHAVGLEVVGPRLHETIDGLASRRRAGQGRPGIHVGPQNTVDVRVFTHIRNHSQRLVGLRARHVPLLSGVMRIHEMPPPANVEGRRRKRQAALALSDLGCRDKF